MNYGELYRRNRGDLKRQSGSMPPANVSDDEYFGIPPDNMNESFDKDDVKRIPCSPFKKFLQDVSPSMFLASSVVVRCTERDEAFHIGITTQQKRKLQLIPSQLLVMD